MPLRPWRVVTRGHLLRGTGSSVKQGNRGLQGYAARMRTKVYANVRWYTTYWIDLQIWYALISWLSFEWWVKCLQVLSVKPSNKVFIVLLHFPFKLYVRNKLQIIKVRVSCKENVACKHDWWRFKKGSSTCVYSFLLFNKLSLCPYMVRKPSISVILHDRYPAIYVNDHIWKCTADFLSLFVWRPFRKVRQFQQCSP